MIRVMNIAVQMTVDSDVPGLDQTRQIAFAYKPEPGDPLVVAALMKNHELALAEYLAANPSFDVIG